MGVQRKIHPPAVQCGLPEDFPERLAKFQVASGISNRALARRLGVSPDRVRRWRKRGVVPSSSHLFMLLTIAESLGLRDGILMRPDRDLSECRQTEFLR